MSDPSDTLATTSALLDIVYADLESGGQLSDTAETPTEGPQLALVKDSRPSPR